ncbi:MAG: hypothetical protein M1823_002419 [Watsoniomyces obsoletus]|nr:MAG: hypothetical protein M1823_002419 [Watsoniomyces obsoletus]
MDAKPQRFGRIQRVFNDENHENIPSGIPAKVIHQRNKSTGTLVPLASNLAINSKIGGVNKRAVLNDKSNIALKKVIRDDSEIGTKSPGFVLGGELSTNGSQKEQQRPTKKVLGTDKILQQSDVKSDASWLSSVNYLNGVVKDTASIGVPPLGNRAVNRSQGPVVRRDTAVYKDGENKAKTAAVAVVRETIEKTTTTSIKDAPIVDKSQVMKSVVVDIEKKKNSSKAIIIEENHHHHPEEPVMVENNNNHSKIHAEIVIPVAGMTITNQTNQDHYAKYLKEFETIRAREQAERDHADQLKREIQEREERLKQITAEREAEREKREIALQVKEAEAAAAAAAEAGAKARRTQRYEPDHPHHHDHPNEAEEYVDAEILDEDGYITTQSIQSQDEYNNTTGGPTVLMAPKVTNLMAQELARAREIVETTRMVEMFDEEDDDNYDVTMVTEYGAEIFTYMGQLETKMSPSPHYMDTQTELQWSMRALLIDWLIQVHLRFGMLPETLFLSVNYIDRFLSVKVVSMGKLQLVGATALLIAAKYEEINSPTLAEMIYMVDGGYTHDEIIKAERFMLSMLKFELGWPGPMSFLRRISKADEYDLDTRTLAKYFLEATLIDERFVACQPSYMAAGAHCLARLMLKKGDWGYTHIYYSNYTYPQLHPLVNAILSCLEAPQRHHQTVYEKFCDKKYRQVALLAEQEVQDGFELPHYYHHRDHHLHRRDEIDGGNNAVVLGSCTGQVMVGGGYVMVNNAGNGNAGRVMGRGGAGGNIMAVGAVMEKN